MGLFCRLNRGVLRAIALVGGVAALLAFAPPAWAQRVLNETWSADGVSQAIQLNADDIATWTDAGQQMFLLHGGVVVSQGANLIRASDGVVWVDMSRFQSERVMHVIVYGENPLDLDRNKATSRGDFGYVRLATTNKVDIKSFKSKVAQADKSGDAVYQRALAGRPAGLKLPAPNGPAQPIRPPLDENFRPAVAVEPLKSTIDPGVRLMGGLQPIPPPPQFPDGVNPPPPPPPNFNPDTPPAVIPTPALAPSKPAPQVSIRGRYFGNPQAQYKPIGNGWTQVIVTGGVNLIVTIPADAPGTKPNTLDIEADRAVIWTRGGAGQVVSTPGQQDLGGGAHEIYLQGHVELRSRTKAELETLRADEIFYDVRRGVAVARRADLEIQSPKLPTSLHLVTDEFLQINPKLYKTRSTTLSGSRLPSDPGLTLNIDDMTVEEFQKPRTYLYFIPAYDKDGKRIVDTQRVFTGRNYVAHLEGVPVFYLPFFRSTVERPLGPLDGVNVGYNTIFGAQFFTTWDMFALLNLPRPEGSRWRLMLDYLTERGPGFGTEYDFAGRDLFGVKSNYSGMVRLYGMFDGNADVLGGDRGNVAFWPDRFSPNPITHPDFRGELLAKFNAQEMSDGFSVLGQVAFLSDRNFLEQFYYNEQLNGMNRDTYLYVKQQQNNWAWSLQGQLATREFMTETDWLPKADGFLLGQTFLEDLLVYNSHASAGYGRLRPASQLPFAYLPTDVRVDSLRLDWIQDVSVPFYLGPVKLAPYGVFDMAYYTQDVGGNGRGRLYGGGGLRANMALSREFPNIQSELFNVNGIDHKINFVGNYLNVYSSSSVNNFPQLDRLNDDVSDQALRNIRPMQAFYNPTYAGFLTTSNLFNPQNYAIRRLLDSNVDTLDTIEVVQLGINQRWQTQRGFPGKEHVIDWMTLNLGVSLFPHSTRDNYGRTAGIVEYDWVWNIGDRTALSANGWFEPFQGGPALADLGVTFNRPDSTALYLGYRQIDPLNSKSVIASFVFPFSAKYAMQASTVWDFGNNISSYSIFVSRMGTDLMVNFGVSYNSTLGTLGVAFEMLPNLARPTGRMAGLFPMPAQNIDPMINQR